MKYTTNYVTFDTAEDVAHYVAGNIDEQYYRDMLDDCYPMADICGYDYRPSYALELVDPIAYRCGFDDYTDSLYDDILWELEKMANGEVQNFYDFDVEAIEEEEA